MITNVIVLLCHVSILMERVQAVGAQRDGEDTAAVRGVSCSEIVLCHFVSTSPSADFSTNNGGCEQNCIETKKDECCSCQDGFHVSNLDWRQCDGRPMGYSF